MQIVSRLYVFNTKFNIIRNYVKIFLFRNYIKLKIFLIVPSSSLYSPQTLHCWNLQNIGSEDFTTLHSIRWPGGLSRYLIISVV